MKPKTIDEIVCDVIRLNHGLSNADDLIGTEEAKQQLLELFMSCVPEKIEWNEQFNRCREQMIKNLEKLK